MLNRPFSGIIAPRDKQVSLLMAGVFNSGILAAGSASGAVPLPRVVR